MRLAVSSTTKQEIDTKEIRRSYKIVILVSLGIFIAFVLIPWLGSVLACNLIDGSTFRAGVKVEDHWGNVRNPEISFSDGWYYWATGSDQVFAGSYWCVPGSIVTRDGWTFQLSAGGTVLTVNGIGYRRVLLNPE